MDSARLSELDRFYSSYIDSGKLQAASYLVARHGKIVAHGSMGALTPDKKSDLRPDSIRKVYSITKVITAVALMKLMEEGKLYVHQPLAAIMPEFDTEYHRKITLWHLLTHTSGLKPDPGVLLEPYTLPWFEWWAREMKKASGEGGNEPSLNWIKLILSGPPLSKPGERWYYSTAGYALLGEVIARVSGVPYEQYIQEQIAGPIGMKRSFFQVPEELRKEVCFTNPWEEKDFAGQRDSSLADAPPKGGNGYYSTLEDLFRFGQMMLEGGSLDGVELIGRRTVQMMTANQLQNVASSCWGADEKDMKHGLGWGLVHHDICTPGTFSHEGYGASGLYVDPVEQLVFAYFVPFTGDWVAEAVIHPRAIIWSSLL